MKKIFKPMVLACTIFCLLACSVSDTLSNLTGSTPAPGAVETNPAATLSPEDIEITRQGELSGQEVKDFVLGAQQDPRGNQLLAWAQQQGYVESNLRISGGERADLSNGGTVRVVGMEKAMLVGFSKIGVNTTTYKLVRLEGSAEQPVVILFDQTGRIEFSNKGIEVYNGDQKLESTQMEGVSMASYIAGPMKQEAFRCTETDQDVFVRCMGGRLMGVTSMLACAAATGITVIGVGAACLVAGKLVWSAPCFVALVKLIAGSTITKCPQWAKCWWESKFDYPPKVEFSLWERTGKSKWIDWLVPSTTGHAIKSINIDIWRARVTVTDDRSPAPIVRPPEGWVEAGSGETAVVYAKDCGNNIVEADSTPSGPDAAEIATAKDNPNQQPPVTQPPAAQPAAPQPPAAATEKTYRGQLCYRWKWDPPYSSDSLPKSWICGEIDDVTFTLRFNEDGSVTQTNTTGEHYNKSGKRDYKPEPDGSYINNYTNPANGDSTKIRLRLDSNGLIYIEDMIFTSDLTKSKKITLAGHFESHYVQVGQ